MPNASLIIGIALISNAILGIALFWQSKRHKIDSIATKSLILTLKDREKKLADIERAAGIGSWDIDHLTSTVTRSAEHFRIFGEHPATRLIDPLFGRIHPDDGDEVKTQFAASIRDHRIFEMEFRIPHASDSTHRWLHRRAAHEYDAEGRVIRSIGTDTDVSPYRDIIHTLSQAMAHAETARQRAKLEESRFRDFASSSADWFWETDEEGRFTSYSGTNNKYIIQDIIGKTPMEFIGGAKGDGRSLNHTSFNDYTKRTTERQPFRDLEFTFEPKPGHLRTVRVGGVPALDPEGNYLGYRGVTRDITEQKRTEVALREQMDTLNAMTDASSDAIVIIDHNGLVSFWNPAATAIFGYSRSEAIGQDAHFLIGGPLDHDAFQKFRPEFQRTGSGAAIGRTLELTAHRKDGRTLQVEMTVSAFRSHGDWHAVGVIRDITERKDTERQFWQNQKMESIGTLAGGIAHDINNMLMPVLGITAAVIDDMPEDNPQKDDLGMVLNAADRIKSLVEGILAFSRNEDVQRKILNIAVVVRDTIPLLRAALPTTTESLENQRRIPSYRLYLELAGRWT